MKALVQRVSEASVTIGDAVHSSIGKGFVILLGIGKGDSGSAAVYLAEKCLALRVFEDAGGKMNLSLRDVSGSALVISQFTLYGDVQRGSRPVFSDAAPPADALPLYEEFVGRMRSGLGDDRVATGVFGATMQVRILNEGPVTILIESKTDI